MQKFLLKFRIWLIVFLLAGGAVLLSHCNGQQQQAASEEAGDQQGRGSIIPQMRNPTVAF